MWFLLLQLSQTIQSLHSCGFRNDSSEGDLKKAKSIPMKVCEYLEKDSTLSLDTLLERAGVSTDSYIHEGSQVFLKGNNYKRQPHETRIKPYNHDLMGAWQASMDIQFIIDAYARVMCVASYMMKNEMGMCELLK